MLCQNCKENTASFHYTQNNNGNISEMHLCAECAKKAGLLDDSHKIWNPFGFNENSSMLDGLLGGIFSSPVKSTLKESSVCPFCGMRLSEFARSGKAGCASCYTTFKNAILPSIKKLHGNTSHAGRFPASRAKVKTYKEKRAELEALLNKAVELQEYEKAAKYRDEIKELDKNKDSQSDDKKEA